MKVRVLASWTAEVCKLCLIMYCCYGIGSGSEIGSGLIDVLFMFCSMQAKSLDQQVSELKLELDSCNGVVGIWCSHLVLGVGRGRLSVGVYALRNETRRCRSCA